MFIIKEIEPTNIEEIELFLSYAGNSLSTFRYFSSRDLSVINNHIVTLLTYKDNIPIAYGHLDRDPMQKEVWLGIAVQEGLHGKGIGSAMMEELLVRAKQCKIQLLYLSVDMVNEAAIHLCKKFSFYVDSELKPGVFLMKCNL
jgi:RimJ/RimL family protein N-acetyltransferase